MTQTYSQGFVSVLFPFCPLLSKRRMWWSRAASPGRRPRILWNRKLHKTGQEKKNPHRADESRRAIWLHLCENNRETSERAVRRDKWFSQTTAQNKPLGSVCWLGRATRSSRLSRNVLTFQHVVLWWSMSRWRTPITQKLLSSHTCTNTPRCQRKAT